jgi:linearmycin/streptolysin S transport system ATP-binding protein
LIDRQDAASTTAPQERVVIEARELRKSYGSRPALDSISLTVRAGEVVGLLGPNGAGKTTTLSILATLLRADAGDVRICDSQPGDDLAAIRRGLGFVPQSIALYPSLSALQNLTLFARIHGIDKRHAHDDSMAMLAEVGLEARAHDPVSTLSSGMKRRLNLACGLVHHPILLMLDEPTVGVDPQSREQILSIVRKIADAGAAVIYSTHYMEEVERLCDRVLLIDRGRLMAAGKVDEIIALAGGHVRMEIAFQKLPARGWWAAVSGVTELQSATEEENVTLALASVSSVGEVLESARVRGGHIIEFNVHNSNLSDAFIALTGHALRDPDPDGR